MTLTRDDRTPTFEFDFADARYDPATDPTRALQERSRDDSTGKGRFHGVGLEGVTGLERYND